jgi:hypothetical protein
MSYHLHTDPALFQIEFHGTLTANDLSELAVELESMEAACEIVPDRIISLEGVTEVSLRGDDVRDIASRRKSRRFPNRFRSAIVASRAASVGYARMFTALNDHPQIKVAVFPFADEAYEWLQSPRGLARSST